MGFTFVLVKTKEEVLLLLRNANNLAKGAVFDPNWPESKGNKSLLKTNNAMIKPNTPLRTSARSNKLLPLVLLSRCWFCLGFQRSVIIVVLITMTLGKISPSLVCQQHQQILKHNHPILVVVMLSQRKNRKIKREFHNNRVLLSFFLS